VPELDRLVSDETPGALAVPDPAGIRTAVVGGGILGMYLALRLRQRGVEVTLLESNPATGGLASPAAIGPYEWDRFYHVILLSDANLLSLLDELGLSPHLRWGVTRTGFYTDGRLHSMSNAIEFLRFPPLGLIDKMRLGATIVRASRISDWRAMERILAVDWLRKWSGPRVLARIWLPLLRSKLGENYRVASAAFIWAIIARMYAARRAGLKTEMFGYVDGGYSTILRALQNRLDRVGVETRYNARVECVDASGDGVAISFQDGGTARFDRAVLTVPTPVIAELCPGLPAPERERLRAVTYQGIVCPSLMLAEPLSSYYVTNITDDDVPFTGVIEMTALVDAGEFGGNSLVYFPHYLTQDSDIWGRNDEAIFEDCIGALQRMYPHFRRESIIARACSRARYVLAVSTLEYSKKLKPPVVTGLPNVFILNSAQIANGTLNVNETLGVVNKNIEPLMRAMRTGKGDRT
jgi:protoporphyrinogen oxidase